MLSPNHVSERPALLVVMNESGSRAAGTIGHRQLSCRTERGTIFVVTPFAVIRASKTKTSVSLVLYVVLVAYASLINLFKQMQQ